MELSTEEFEGLLKSNPHKYCNARYIAKHHPNIYKEIMNSPGDSFKVKLYTWKNHIIEIPSCPICGAPVKFGGSNVGFRKYCSTKCSANSSETKEKANDTFINKYGGRGSASNIIKSKVSNTMLERYGVEAPLQHEQIKQKFTNTCMQKYGVAMPSAHPDIKRKVKETNELRYGGVWLASPIIKNKTHATNINRYGVAIPSQSEQIKEKTKTTCLERYGVEHAGSVPEFQEKRKRTCKERYGVESMFQNDNVRSKFQSIKNQHFIDNNEHILRYDAQGNWVCKCPHPDTCNKCDTKEYVTNSVLYRDRLRIGAEVCTTLQPVSSPRSSLELMVQSWLDEQQVEYICNARNVITPQELDIYIPSLQLAIEVNGNYYHSESEKPKKYHMNKYLACRELGIRLITFWEDWLHERPEWCKNILLYHIGAGTNVEPSNLVDVGMFPLEHNIKPHRCEHGGFWCWDSGIYV